MLLQISLNIIVILFQYTLSNKGDRYISLTLRKQFHFGTLINLTIQSLPAMDMKLVYKIVETKG